MKTLVTVALFAFVVVGCTFKVENSTPTVNQNQNPSPTPVGDAGATLDLTPAALAEVGQPCHTSPFGDRCKSGLCVNGLCWAPSAPIPDLGGQPLADLGTAPDMLSAPQPDLLSQAQPDLLVHPDLLPPADMLCVPAANGQACPSVDGKCCVSGFCVNGRCDVLPMSLPDMLAPPDIQPSPDLIVSPDMTASPDLAPVPDQGTSPDLGAQSSDGAATDMVAVTDLVALPDLTVLPDLIPPVQPDMFSLKSQCNDGSKNGDETDTDCGGQCALAPVFNKCSIGMVCKVQADCWNPATLSIGNCVNGVCGP